MVKNNFYSRGQSLIGIIIVLVTVGLITGGLYYYLQKQIPEVPEIAEKPAEEETKSEEEISEEISPKEKIEEEPEEVKPEITEPEITEPEITEPEITEPKITKPEVTCQNECSQIGLKRCSGSGYQTCGNYDADNCLEWGPTINCPATTICQNGICIQPTQQEQKCSDGTFYGQCSTNKPKYCDNGNLTDNCQLCGCPLGMTCNIESKNCFTPITVTNYYNICWDYDCSSKYPPYPKLTESLKPSAINKCKECYLQGEGKVNIIIVFLYAYDPLPNEYINILKGPENDVRSFKYAAKWYEEEAEKYNINLDIDINFSESQFKVPKEYIVHTYEESFSKNLTNYIKENLHQFSAYDVIVSFYYGSYDFSFANHVSSKNSFEIFSKQYTPGVFYPDFTEGSTNYSETFAHELTHLFGATDKYTCLDPSSESCTYAKENGIGCWIESEDPNQLGKDIMCHRVPKYDGGWGFINPPLNELVIIEVTAKEIGWYDADKDGMLEVNDFCPFNQLNDCI